MHCRATFAWKVVASFLMYAFVSSEASLPIALFMILNRTVPQGAFYLFNLPLSDIIDHDNAVNNRPHSMSSTVFGLNALFTKPAQSIGPMIVFSLLLRSGYQPQFVTCLQADDDVALNHVDVNIRTCDAHLHPCSAEHGQAAAFETVAFRADMFAILCLVPLFLGTLQMLVWSQYGLRGDDKRRKPAPAGETHAL